MCQKVTIYNGENSYLVLSSMAFLIPGFYCSYKKDKWFTPMFLTGPFISGAFWWNPQYNWKRLLDIYAVNIGMGLFVYNSLTNIKNKRLAFYIHTMYMAGGAMFYNACLQHTAQNPKWFMYHLSFHGLMWSGHFLNAYATLEEL